MAGGSTPWDPGKARDILGPLADAGATWWDEMIGVRADGRKELIALTDGYRESAESWADLLRDCARRGMRALALAVGDGALGFWGGLREVFPETGAQRCWFHRSRKDSMCRFAHC